MKHRRAARRGTWSGRLERRLRLGSFGRDDEGASLVEYALLLALIAVVAVGALTFLGKTVSSTLNTVGNTIATGGSGGGAGTIAFEASAAGGSPVVTASFTSGQANTFQFYATGTGPTAFTATGLPPGVTLTSAGVLSGSPTSTTGSPFTLDVTATNSSGTGSETFTLTVTAPATPVFSAPTSNSATFTVGTSGSVTFTASPVTSYTESGALPTGVTFNSTTGVLSGTPASGTGAVYGITVTAHNGAATAADSITLTVNEPNGAPTPSSGQMTDETASTITISASGYPAPVISNPDPQYLPNGVTFTGGNGTATLTIGNNNQSRNDCYSGFFQNPTTYKFTLKSSANGVSGSSDQTTTFSLTMNCNQFGH